MPEPFPTAFGFDLYVAVLDRKGYIVGDANANSGLHVLAAKNCAVLAERIGAADEAWQHFGWNNVRCFGFDISPGDPADATLFLAGGNGVHASTDLASWRVTTDWQFTEVLDVVVAPGYDSGDTVVAATAYGPIVSFDHGVSWRRFADGLERRSTSATFCSNVAASVDGTRLMLGTEDGVFKTKLDSRTSVSRWRSTGPRGVCVRSIVEDAFKPAHWYVATDGSGLLVLEEDSEGETAHRIVLDSSVLYAVAGSRLTAGLIATAGFEATVWMSSDFGKTFSVLAAPSENISIHALAFDPVDANVLWVGTTDSGVFRVDLVAKRWTFAGLTDASIRKLQFVASSVFRTEDEATTAATAEL